MADLEIRIHEREAELQCDVRIQVEAISDLSTVIETANTDISVLEDCLVSRKEKLFKVREENKACEREQNLAKEIFQSSCKDLIEETHRETSRNRDLESRVAILKSSIEELDREIIILRRNVSDYEKDREPFDKLKEEFDLTAELKQHKKNNQKLAVENESLKDKNSRSQEDYHISKTVRESTSRQSKSRRSEPEIVAIEYEEQKDEEKGQTFQMRPTRISVRSPLGTQNKSIEVYEDRSTKDHLNNMSHISNPNDQSFGGINLTKEDYDETSSMLIAMHDDLLVVKQRKEDILGALKSKIQAIEEELDLNYLI